MLTVGDAHNLYTALQRLDADASLKLKDEVRLAVIINMNRLQEHIKAYEKLRQQVFIEMRENGFKGDELLFNAKFTQRDLALRDTSLEIGLAKISLDDLVPTKGEHFIPNRVWLKPMIKDWPE